LLVIALVASGLLAGGLLSALAFVLNDDGVIVEVFISVTAFLFIF
jgi:hypothetical protein